MATTIQLGGQPVEVARFKSYKAVLAGEIMEGVSEQIDELIQETQDFRRAYRERNPLVFTPELCNDRIADLENVVHRGEQALAAEAGKEAPDEDAMKALQNELADLRHRIEGWKATRERIGDRESISVPQDPPDEQVYLHVWPKAFKMRKQVFQLLGLIVTKDDDLLPMWLDEDVREKLQQIGAKIFETSHPDELMHLALATKKILGDEFRPLMPLFRELTGQVAEEQEPEETQEEPQPVVATVEPEQEPVPALTAEEAQTSSSQTSSTPSPAPTDGTSAPSGSESPGASLSPSSVA